MTKSYFANPRPNGAALVVGLILLVVLSLMAISSMNSASLDLVIAGNEQFHTRAFAAAETGIENGLLWNGGNYDSANASPVVTGSTGIGSDQYQYQVTPVNNGIVQNVAPFNSAGKFGAIYFRIAGTGVSARNATATSLQELFLVVNSGSDQSCVAPASCDLGG